MEEAIMTLSFTTAIKICILGLDGDLIGISKTSCTVKQSIQDGHHFPITYGYKSQLKKVVY